MGICMGEWVHGWGVEEINVRTALYILDAALNPHLVHRSLLTLGGPLRKMTRTIGDQIRMAEPISIGRCGYAPRVINVWTTYMFGLGADWVLNGF